MRYRGGVLRLVVLIYYTALTLTVMMGDCQMLRVMKYQNVVAERHGLWKQNPVAQEHHRFTSSPSQTDPPVASFLTPKSQRAPMSRCEGGKSKGTQHDQGGTQCLNIQPPESTSKK
jgi:hypothetical protein